jgi:hypothetical protein
MALRDVRPQCATGGKLRQPFPERPSDRSVRPSGGSAGFYTIRWHQRTSELPLHVRPQAVSGRPVVLCPCRMPCALISCQRPLARVRTRRRREPLLRRRETQPIRPHLNLSVQAQRKQLSVIAGYSSVFGKLAKSRRWEKSASLFAIFSPSRLSALNPCAPLMPGAGKTRPSLIARYSGRRDPAQRTNGKTDRCPSPEVSSSTYGKICSGRSAWREAFRSGLRRLPLDEWRWTSISMGGTGVRPYRRRHDRNESNSSAHKQHSDDHSSGHSVYASFLERV